MNDRRQVMIVDDMPFMRNILASILAMGGYTVVAEAASGLEAVELHRQHRPYVTLMDVKMPEMDGIEATLRIRAMDAGARIVLCGIRNQQGLENYAALGVRGVITKPYKAEEVLKIMQRVNSDHNA